VGGRRRFSQGAGEEKSDGWCEEMGPTSFISQPTGGRKKRKKGDLLKGQWGLKHIGPARKKSVRREERFRLSPNRDAAASHKLKKTSRASSVEMSPFLICSVQTHPKKKKQGGGED